MNVDPARFLDDSVSSGRRIPQVSKDSTGKIYVYDPPSTPCPGCGNVTDAGEPITKVYRAWWHLACAQAWLDAAGVDEAWKVIARQIADHPSRFRTPEIRAAIQALLKICEQNDASHRVAVRSL